MMLTATADEWWRTGVGYCLDLERFADGDGDGHGDLLGMGQHLDHLTRLGVTFVWLQPFYPSPEGDDGYDISDYYAVDPEVGDLGLFTEVVRALRERGIRVLVDLVVNHTSVEHPWFQDARSSRDSAHRDWYVWRDEPDPADDDAELFFPDAEDSVWTYDEAAGQFFRHRFYSHQPDLNTSEPQVRDEIRRIMGFWLALGVSGFRVDAVPYFLETATREGDADDDGADGRPRPEREALSESYAMLDLMRTFLSRRSAEAVMLGEVNTPYEEQTSFFGGPNARMTMNFDFVLNQRMHLALARRDAGPVLATLRERPELPDSKAFGVFVRNHDELTLDQLAEDELAEVLAAFGPDEDQQIFGRGLRLRAPSMLGHDRERLEMVYALAFAVPGTPVLYYGEELAQDEDLSLPGRLAVRTRVRWGTEPDGRGVEDQERDPGSPLHFFRTLVARYRDRPELGRGEVRLLDVGSSAVVALESRWGGRRTTTLHNLGEEPVEVHVPADGVAEGDHLLDLFAREEVEADAGGGLTVQLGRYGYRWYAHVH
ncbi:alpha-amylase family glycosyl hydrolase [Pseudokineococcus sp. 1T1Z-3]|uniref:alpha-amylase family glycosyl hydrolase n=1 Tax=Pseudokineococcus sp. 1T1Z-3 TaxID=3132745 RepID=UPI0030A274C1